MYKIKSFQKRVVGVSKSFNPESLSKKIEMLRGKLLTQFVLKNSTEHPRFNIKVIIPVDDYFSIYV